MSKYFIKPERAIPMLQELAVASRKWGKNLSVPYSVPQIIEAIELADAQGVFEPRDEVISKEEVTLLRRQLAACQNREKARKHDVA